MIGQALLAGGEVLFRVVDAVLQGVDLAAHRHQFDLPAFRSHGALRQFAVQSGKLALLVAQQLLGVAQRLRLGGELFFRRTQLVLQRLLARLEREDRGVLFAQLDFQAVDRVGFLAEFGKLAGGLVLELLDAHFEPPRGHRELGPQLVLVRLNLGHRQGRGGLETLRRQPHRAVVNQRHDHQSEQHRNQKTDRQIHDRLDHHAISLPVIRLRLVPKRGRAGGPAGYHGSAALSQQRAARLPPDKRGPGWPVGCRRPFS